MRHFKNFQISNLLIGVVFTLFFLSFGVIFTINFRPLYYFDVNHLNIEQTSGLSKEEILLNYNALIDYSSPFYRGELEFPTLPASQEGIQHFKEVKDIFIAFYGIAAITFLVGVLIILYKKKRKDYKYLPVVSLTSIILPLLVGFLVMIDFDNTFRVFHELFFNNDYWIFDPATDPVIELLPASFFLHCALLIIFIVLMLSIIVYLTYKRTKKHSGIRHRKINGLKL